MDLDNQIDFPPDERSGICAIPRNAHQAVRDLIRSVGEDPDREGLRETPDRVVRAWKEYFAGYNQNPISILSKTFSETEGYDGIISLYDIPFVSHCEHHIAPFVGKAHVAYIPKDRVVGISKLARLVEIFARRLQIQERLTAQVAGTIEQVLNPLGVAVMVEAAHSCVAARGVSKQGTLLTTRQYLGRFQAEAALRREFEAGAANSPD